MSQSTDVIERGLEAFNRGDTDTVAATVADDVRWEGPGSEELPALIDSLAIGRALEIV